MRVDTCKNTSFTGYAYKVFKPSNEALREAAMAAKTKRGYYVLIAKSSMADDNRMVDLLEKAGKILNKDYFISKKNYNPPTGDVLDISALEAAKIEFDPRYAIKPAGKIPTFQYETPEVKTA